MFAPTTTHEVASIIKNLSCEIDIWEDDVDTRAAEKFVASL